MKFKKSLSIALAAASVMGLAAGCGNNTTTDNGEVETLVWMVPSSELTDKEAVEAAMNEITVPKIGAKIQISTIDPGAYDEKMRMKLAAGDADFDIMFTGYLSNYATNVDNEVLLPMTELINENCPELWDAIPEYVWEDAKIDGEIYAVPNVQIMATTYCYGIQTKLAEKYGWTKERIESPEELNDLLAAIKEGEPDIYPYRTNYGLSMWLNPKYESVGGGYLDKYGDGKTVLNPYTVPEYKQGVDTLRDWYEKGYIRKDVASVGDDNTDFQAGRYAVNSFTWKPGMGLQYPDWTFVKVGDAFMSSGACRSTMTGINHKTKHAEKAIKLIALAQTDKDFYNLLTIGIEGKHYTLAEDGRYEGIKDSGYGIAAWMMGNQFNALVNVNQDFDVWEQTEKVNDEAKKSNLGGFSFKDDNVKVEQSALSAAMGPYTATGNGSQDPATYWDEMMGKINAAGIDKIIAETQTQLDAFLASK